MEKFLYKDKFVELYHNKLILKCYYFPTTKSKIIPLTDITTINYDTQENSMVFTIGWGMTIFGIWWAKDLRRQFPSFKTKYSNVILDTGSNIKQRFTVMDIDKFLEALLSLKSNVMVVNKISDKFYGNVCIHNLTIETGFSNKENKTLKAKKNQFNYSLDQNCAIEPPPSYDQAVNEFEIRLD